MSSDILDAIDDLDGDDFEETQSSNELIVNEEGEILELEDLESLTEDEAEEITEAIRSTVTATYVLLARAHEGKAYKALGYSTWEEYVREEFDFSTQRSYQLLDLAKVTKIIESAAPEGTVISLTEAQARDIKRELPKITQRIEDETEGLSGEESSDVIDSIIDDARDQAKADKKATESKDAANAEAEEEAERARLEEEANTLLGIDGSDGLTDSADSEYLEIDVEGDGSEHSARDKMSIYNFFNLTENFDTLPEPEEMIALIPAQRRDEVRESIKSITQWANRFHTLLEEQFDDE